MNVGVMPLPPDILIVQDKSGSMSDDDSDLSYGRAIAPRHGTREQPYLSFGTVLAAALVVRRRSPLAR
ncbi:MAG TPA: hypothetical protein VLC06_21715 [Polyangia bacterium]|nr:hypothetical protein [Polyangia bacterium]